MNPLCKIRDIQKALEVYEMSFEQLNGLSLKEGMLMCCLSEKECTATELANQTDMTSSNCSKIISSIEKKGFVVRQFGKDDKRNMWFTLTESGTHKLRELKLHLPELPDILK